MDKGDLPRSREARRERKEAYAQVVARGGYHVPKARGGGTNAGIALALLALLGAVAIKNKSDEKK